MYDRFAPIYIYIYIKYSHQTATSVRREIAKRNFVILFHQSCFPPRFSLIIRRGIRREGNKITVLHCASLEKEKSSWRKFLARCPGEGHLPRFNIQGSILTSRLGGGKNSPSTTALWPIKEAVAGKGGGGESIWINESTSQVEKNEKERKGKKKKKKKRRRKGKRILKVLSLASGYVR